MRSIAFALGAAAIFCLGATGSTSCLSSLLPLLGNGVTIPLTVSIHVINDAYSPVSVSLIVDEPKSGTAASLAAADSTTDAPATQPAGGSTVDKGQDVKLVTLPCAAIVAPISLEAKVEGDGSNSSASASSPNPITMMTSPAGIG